MKRILLSLALLCWAFLASANTKPNLVIFIADDMSYYDVGSWGFPGIKTPHLDKLASEGMKLTRCYTPAPVCSPTRLALYTALYPIKNGGYPNHSAVKNGTKSMVHFLRALDYRVGIVGKTMIAPEDSFPFDLPRTQAPPKTAPKKEKKAAGKAGDEEDKEEDLDFGAISKYVKEKSQPFCLVVASHQPHGPWNKGEASLYNPATITMPPYVVDTPETREERARYLSEVSFLDSEVGRVLKILDETGQAENTLFMFLSEQGSSFPGGKYNLYDVGVRAAVIARWPGKIKAGSESDALCSYVDIIPTFIDAAGGKPVPGLDGRSLLNVLTGKTKKHLDYVFAQSTSLGVNGVTTPYGIRAVRDDRYKLIWNIHHQNEFPCSRAAHSHTSSWVQMARTNAVAREKLDRFLHRPEFELYDLKKDPWEQKNIAAEPKHRQTVAKLKQELDGWMREQGDLGDATERDAEKRLKKFLKVQSPQAAIK